MENELEEIFGSDASRVFDQLPITIELDSVHNNEDQAIQAVTGDQAVHEITGEPTIQAETADDQANKATVNERENQTTENQRANEANADEKADEATADEEAIQTTTEKQADQASEPDSIQPVANEGLNLPEPEQSHAADPSSINPESILTTSTSVH